MNHPKCKLCGKRHRLGPCAATKPEPTPVAKAAPAKFDRNAYQREYMRKRRAAIKKEPE